MEAKLVCLAYIFIYLFIYSTADIKHEKWSI